MIDINRRKKVIEYALAGLRDTKAFMGVLISNERARAILALEKLQSNPGNCNLEGEAMLALLELEGFLGKFKMKDQISMVRNIMESLFLKPQLN